MSDVIQELAAVIREKDLSVERASKYIGASTKQTYRWLARQSEPSFLSKEAIRRALKKMRGLPSNHPSPTEIDRDLYRVLLKKMAYKEKIWLLDAGGDYEKYRQRLRDLAAKYSLKAEA